MIAPDRTTPTTSGPPEVAATYDHGRLRSRLPMRLRREGGWLGAALGTVGIVWTVVLVIDPRHFFSGDTEQAYYGWWYTVGEALRHGHLALLDPTKLSYGNHVVDGQPGLYNALIALIGLGSTVAPQLVVYATIVKMVTAAGGIVGCYLLVRGYRVAPPLAAAAAVAVALCGFTYGFASARWFPGQLGVALLPWAWWAIRRLLRGRSPFPALVFCYLIVTIGYVYPTLYLGAVLLACLVEALVSVGRRAVLKVLLVGVFCALVAVLVYLPAMRTAGFTIRGGDQIDWSGPNQLHWWQIPLLYQPVGRTEPRIFKFTTWSPVEYVVWWLPLLLLVEPRTVRERWRELLPLLVGAVVWPLWSIGPAAIGPLRWPARSLEAMTLMAAVFVVVAVARGTTRRPTRRRIAVVAAFVVITEGLVVLWHHDQAWQRLVSGVVVAAGLAAAALWIRNHRRVGAVLLAGSLGFGIVAATVPQTAEPALAMPDDKAAYHRVLGRTRGTVLVVDATNAPDYTAARGRHLLRGTLWALTDKPVVNGDTPALPTAFYQRFKDRYMGAFRPEGLGAMLEREPTTGKRFLDLLGIGTVVLERGFPWGPPPPGWHVAGQNAVTRTWIRDTPITPTGGVAWTSPGTSVRTVSRGPLGVSLRVTDVPAGGGSVVLSRVAYPGYQVSGTPGAALADPLADILVRVHIPATARGRTLKIVFRPPGWHAELASAGLAAILAVGWAGLWLWRRRRSRTADTVPA